MYMFSFLRYYGEKGNHQHNFTAGMSYLFLGYVFIIIGLGNVLSPFGAKPLPNQMLTDGEFVNIKTTIAVHFLENYYIFSHIYNLNFVSEPDLGFYMVGYGSAEEIL